MKATRSDGNQFDICFDPWTETKYDTPIDFMACVAITSKGKEIDAVFEHTIYSYGRNYGIWYSNGKIIDAPVKWKYKFNISRTNP